MGKTIERMEHRSSGQIVTVRAAVRGSRGYVRTASSGSSDETVYEIEQTGHDSAGRRRRPKRVAASTIDIVTYRDDRETGSPYAALTETARRSLI